METLLLGKQNFVNYPWKEMRTANSISANQSEWIKETNRNRKLLKNYKNCEFQPIPLRKEQGEQAVIFILPPNPLYVNLLGPVNDCMETQMVNSQNHAIAH